MSVSRREAAWQAGLAQIDKLVQAESISRASSLWLDQRVTPAGHMAVVYANNYTTGVSACEGMQT